MVLISPMLSILFASFSVTILFLGLAFFWYQRTYLRPYKQFPSFRIDVKLLFKALTGQHPKNVPSTSVLFQELTKGTRKFYRDELCIAWVLRPFLLIYGENIMKIFFHESAVVNKSTLYDNVKEALGDGILISKEELWKPHRKLVNPAFSLKILKGNMPVFNQNAVDLVSKIQSIGVKPTEDILSMLKKCAFNILAASILGMEMNDELFESRIKHCMKLVDGTGEFLVYKITRPWLNWHPVSSLFSAGRKYNEIIKKIDFYMNEIIDDLLKSCAAPEGLGKYSDNDEMQVKKSLAQILVEQHLHDSTFTREYLQFHLANISAAGYDTIAYSIMWCLYVLGHHPEVQREACREIESIVLGEDVTYDDLVNLKYLDCILKESLRLHPTVPAYARQLGKEINYGKYTIPKGTDIVFFTFMLHRNPDIYPEPEKFKPERFADSSDIRPWMHIPFAEGYRNCIGKRFAMMEMKVLLVHVLRRFEVQSLDTVKDEDLDWSIVLKTIKPLRMLFKPRMP